MLDNQAKHLNGVPPKTQIVHRIYSCVCMCCVYVLCVLCVRVCCVCVVCVLCVCVLCVRVCVVCVYVLCVYVCVHVSRGRKVQSAFNH